MRVACLVAALCALNGVHSRDWINEGYCPDTIKPMQNFDLAKFAGIWIDIGRLGMRFEFIGNCIQYNYTPNQGGDIDVKIGMMNLESDSLKYIEGNAKLKDNSAAFNVTLRYGSGYRAFSWSVLDTDYENYAVMYLCVDHNGVLYREEAWIWGRQVTLGDEHRKKSDKVLAANGMLDTKLFHQTVQTCGIIM